MDILATLLQGADGDLVHQQGDHLPGQRRAADLRAQPRNKPRVMTLTTPRGVTLTADSDVELADKWGQLEHGEAWDAAPLFTEHTAMWAYFEALVEFRDNPTSGYTNTNTNTESETDQ